MLEGIRCLDENVHDAHDIVITLDTPCSGPIECGNTRDDHEPHRIVRRMDAHCPGVGTSLN